MKGQKRVLGVCADVRVKLRLAEENCLQHDREDACICNADTLVAKGDR